MTSQGWYQKLIKFMTVQGYQKVNNGKKNSFTFILLFMPKTASLKRMLKLEKKLNL